MKFYELIIAYKPYETMGELESFETPLGKWATREDAEQAAKDAVEMAKFVQQVLYEIYDGKAAHMRDPRYVDAQAIIERYEGGQHG